MFPFPSRRGYLSVIATFTLAFFFSSSTAFTQEATQGQSGHRARIEQVFEGLNRGRSIAGVAVSPDGRRIAWIEGGRGGGLLYVAPVDEMAKGVRVPSTATAAQNCSQSEAIWAPDSTALAFFSNCASSTGQEELYLSRLDGTPARRLTELNGYEHSPAFSPDGTKIAFLYVDGATRPAGALAAMKAPSGVIGEEGIEIQRVAIAQVDAAAPTAPAQVSPANLHVYEFDWSPDSKRLAYVAADPPGENNWWVAKLYTQAIGGSPKAILAPAEVTGPLHKLQIAVPRWSPDGRQIAFIGGLMSDQGSTGGDVWIVSAEGGAPRNLTPGTRTSPSWIEWDGAGHLFVSELSGGNSDLARFRVKEDQLTEEARIFSIPGSVGDGRFEGSLSTTADRSLWVFGASSFDRPPEIYAAHVGNGMPAGGGFAGVTQLSRLNDGVAAAWGSAVSLDWKNEGYDAQGWLLLPQGYDPAKKYPLIVEVHGGPAAAVVPRWGSGGGISAVALSALGYFVLEPNPRGSYGQGEAFTQANRKDFGYGDLRDILKGVDTVEAKYPIDPARVGLTGWSYGGFMTMFAVTQTDRFKAAVAGAGISDWESYYGENSIDQWMTPYFGASVYDDPAIYAKASAVTYIKKVRTPTLVVVGDRDGECPAPQSFEFWHALRNQGVPTRLVVYPNEGHGFVNPIHRRDVMERTVEWFAHYLPPA